MIKILVAGDYVPLNDALASIESSRFDILFGDIKGVISVADYSLVNLECPLTTNKANPIRKSGPNLGCTNPKMLDALIWAGFNCVTLANNHFRDYGEDGVDTTLQACEKMNLDYVGGGHNLHEASTILYKNINSKTVAFINACEEEYSIATPNSGGSNPLRPIQLFYDIQKARNKADYVLLILHGGIERYPLPTPRMQETFRFLIDAGADAVINHHQHCYSGYEIYKGHPIFYGLGNFSFCKPNAPKSWNEGFMVCLTLCEDKEPSFELIPYLQGSSISQMQGEASQHFHKNVTMLNNIISSPEKLKSSYQELLNKNHKSSLMQLEPFKNSFIRKLQWHHLFPHINSVKHYLTLLDLISCESHRENMIHTLRHEIQISDD